MADENVFEDETVLYLEYTQEEWEALMAYIEVVTKKARDN